jgi:AsmA family protein
MAARRIPTWTKIVGGVAVVLVLVAAFWSWAWFIPLIETRASAAAGRPVSIGDLDVDLGRVMRVTLDDIVVGNPENFPAPENAPFARVGRLSVDIDVVAYVRRHVVSLPQIAVERPEVYVAATDDGQNNYTFPTSDTPSDPDAKPPEIRNLTIADGHAKVVIPKLKADFDLTIATRVAEPTGKPQIVVDAKGRYAGQPITGRLIGGAVLALQEENQPYPIDLRLANGPTKVTLVGTVQDPLHFKGIDVKLSFAGADMAALMPLTGVPIPATPSYEVTGNLAYADGKIRFENFSGKVGNSDLEGTIAVDPGSERPHVVADLASKSVDLEDLGGFIGAQPGDANAQQTQQQKQEFAAAKADPKLLPDEPINMPKIRAADVDLTYRGAKIKGRNMPFDSIGADLTIKDGRITLKPLTLGVGDGRIEADIDLEPLAQDRTRMRADVDFRHLSLSRLMKATQVFEGEGTLGGKATLHATGNSMATFLGNGDGELILIMTGGDLSSLLVSLSGLQFGNAVVNALGLPTRSPLRCMVVDMPLKAGVLETKVVVIDTEADNIYGNGSVNLKTEQIDYRIRTEGKHPTVGSIPAPINISGPLKSPTILPGAEAAVRGGAAALLGAVLTPLAALIPTIQLGVGEDTDCGELIHRVTTGKP